ncbi:hypothetical protein [Actinoplanes auranticolor]|uniref:Uncharacterized protein n=1 Tax=Actinoplanes auranticolor TaxID=47988 RepID=A0A919SCF0_9ACTN|nr:hypothetical protein [Actinoplanes auranticolor]GIM69847.1 hypothetical protein Aau02nite_38180 [Actinoplanes auranticolor]
MPTVPDAATLRRVMSHPAVWSVLVAALLGWAAMPFNNGHYEYWINFDPQGDGQQQEWVQTRRIFRYTSGVLCGQLLALVAGVALSRRHRHAVALTIAVPLGAVLAVVTVALAFPFAWVLESSRPAAVPAFDDPILTRVLLGELAAYPLYAAAGVGLGILVRRSARLRKRKRLLVPLFLLFWTVTTLTGLVQDDEYDAWPWLLWAVPFVAAGTAIALAGLSADAWEFPPVPVGDWGRSATLALLASAAAYALILNLLAVTRRRGDRPPADSPAAGSGPTADAHP